MKSNYYKWVLQHTFFQWNASISALLIDGRAALPRNNREIISELVLSKIEKESTMNKFYNIPCFNGIPQFLLLAYMTGASLPKKKREISSELVLSKREKATTMSEFYNIPSLDGMPQILLFL